MRLLFDQNLSRRLVGELVRPAGTQPGDLIVASIAGSGLLGAPTGLSQSGWTVGQQRTNGLVRTWVLYRYATATDPPSWSFTATGANNTSVALSTYRNAAPTGVVTASATGATSAASTHPLPQVTTPSPANHLVHVVGLNGNVNPAAPGSTTQRAAISSGASLLVADRVQDEPGTAPPASATSDLAINTASVTLGTPPKVWRHRL